MFIENKPDEPLTEEPRPTREYLDEFKLVTFTAKKERMEIEQPKKETSNKNQNQNNQKKDNRKKNQDNQGGNQGQGQQSSKKKRKRRNKKKKGNQNFCSQCGCGCKKQGASHPHIPNKSQGSKSEKHTPKKGNQAQTPRYGKQYVPKNASNVDEMEIEEAK